MRCVVTVLIFAVLVVGCGSKAPGTLGQASPPTPHASTAVNWGLVGVSDVPTLDPALASDPTSITVASLVYGGLVRFDRHLKVQPDGASHWVISRNGKTYTFFLRPNLRFADGTRVTAEDIVSALDRALGPEGPAGTAPFYLQLIVGSTSGSKPSGIVAVNSSTVRITLTHPAAHFLSELAFPASFVPEPALPQKYGASWTDHAMGFGPYMVKSWRHNRYLTLVRNPYYYGGSVGPPRISLRFYAQGNAVAAYDNGTLDVVSGSPAGEILASNPPGARRLPALALDYLALNTSRLPFKRLNARRAFAAAIRPDVASTTMGSSAFPSAGLVPSALAIPLARWAPSESESTYLARARYPHGHKFPPIVLVIPQDPHLHALARALKLSWFRRLNIDVRIQQLNATNYTQILNAHAFDLALVRWGGDFPDPQDFLGTQLGASPYNVTGWSKPTYNAAVQLADSYSPLDPRRRQLLRHAAFIATRSLPVIPLDEPAVTAIIRPDLHDFALTSLGTIVLQHQAPTVTR
jgi:peptide/nickel transport system substrate-binding protein/oligopeptide transport system substrate-binding protein